MSEIQLVIHGSPRGKGRPRFSRKTGRAYTPEATVSAEQRVQAEWIAAGRPELAGPLELHVAAVMARPQNHWRLDGTLGKPGLRSEWPCKRPDLDNHIKLVLDALNGQAFADDAQIVRCSAVKRWANPGELEHTKVLLCEIPPTSIAHPNTEEAACPPRP